MPVVIPPWLELPNFVQAAEAGANIGQRQHESAVNALLKQQEMQQQAGEAAGQLGLGYARVNAEQASAAAARKEAEARLALQQGHYSDLNNLGQERLQQGDERLAATQTQRSAANDLKQQGLDLQADRFNTSSDQRQQEIDLNTKRFMAMGAKPKEAGEQGVIAAKAGFDFLNDPDHEKNPQAALDRHPGASSSAAVIDWLKKRNLAPTTTTITSFPNNTEQRTTVKSEPSESLQSGGLGAVGAAPAQQKFQAGQQVNQNGHIYEFDGQKWNPVQ